MARTPVDFKSAYAARQQNTTQFPTLRLKFILARRKLFCARGHLSKFYFNDKRVTLVQNWVYSVANTCHTTAAFRLHLVVR